MFGLALVAGIAHFVVHSAPGAEIWKSIVNGTFGFLAIVLTGLGAPMGGFRAHREYSRLAKRSRSMASALRHLDADLADVETPEALIAALRTTEEFMVQETQDWLMLMRAAPLKQAGLGHRVYCPHVGWSQRSGHGAAARLQVGQDRVVRGRRRRGHVDRRSERPSHRPPGPSPH